VTYSDFTVDNLRKTFGIAIKQKRLFEAVEPLEVTPWLEASLDKGMKLALISEKARSELIVVPILLTSRELTNERFYFYSGARFDVDRDKGLSGECDFILTYTDPSPTIQSPIITMVEAKKNDIDEGLGQCGAQMVAARIFNQNEGSGIETIFGCVTTGEIWQYLKLEDSIIYIDSVRYYIDNVGQILGVLQKIIDFYQK
jgi:hypothetical protein